MELIQIIITTLKLFVLLASIIVLISYFIYKVKDRKRIKPYSTNPAFIPQIESIEVKEDHLESKQARFQVLNIEAPPEDYSDDEIIIKKQIEKNYNSQSPLKYKRSHDNKAFNIYDHYSNSNFEPMHKIKL